MTHLRSTGKCACGNIVFDFDLTDRNAHACHCGLCRRWSGHIWASVNAPLKSLQFKHGGADVVWWQSSDFARRGHCAKCGSALFWHVNKIDEKRDHIAISAGSIDPSAGIVLSKHIFVVDKPSYYEIGDGLEQVKKY